MIRSATILVILVSTLLQTACSTGHDFVIANRSGGQIEIQYEWKGCTSGSSVDILSPGKLTISEFEQSVRDWRPISEQQFRQTACQFTVVVEPNEALRVEKTSNYRGHHAENSDLHFGIHKLRITGWNGTILFEGRQTQTSFKKNESGNYVIDYQ